MGQSYAKKLGKMIITKKSGGRLGEQKIEQKLELEERDTEDEEEQAQTTFMSPGFGTFSIGRIAGSRTKLDTELTTYISASKFRSIREVSQQIQEKVRAQTQKSYYAIRLLKEVSVMREA